jgi:hypothetical protein
MWQLPKFRMNLNPDFETGFTKFGTCCIKRGPSLHLVKNKIVLRQMAGFSLGEVLGASGQRFQREGQIPKNGIWAKIDQMNDRRSFSYRVSELLAVICWCLLYLLRNRRQGWLGREEIRSARFSFSQFGEDLVIEELLNQMGISHGFYVDVGAFDPVIGSNTLLLFRRGWSGVKIEVDERRIERFRRARPRDWNLACGVSKVAGRKQFARYAYASMTRLITGTDDRSVLRDPPQEIFEADARPLQAILEDSPFRGRPRRILCARRLPPEDRLPIIAREFLDTVHQAAA